MACVIGNVESPGRHAVTAQRLCPLIAQRLCPFVLISADGLAQFDTREWPTSRAGCGWVASPPLVANEVGDGHHLVAVGTAATRADSPTEELAVGTALLSQVARPARRALVDGPQAGHTVRGWQLIHWAGVAMPPSGLPTGIRAVAAASDGLCPRSFPARGVEWAAAHRADRPSYRYAIVTRREDAAGRGAGGRVSHGDPSCHPFGVGGSAPAPPQFTRHGGIALDILVRAGGETREPPRTDIRRHPIRLSLGASPRGVARLRLAGRPSGYTKCLLSIQPGLTR